MKLQKKNWHGFKHDKVNERFLGDLTFINSFNVNDEYQPSSVYRAANPDTSKGHKEFMLMTSSSVPWCTTWHIAHVRIAL